MIVDVDKNAPQVKGVGIDILESMFLFVLDGILEVVDEFRLFNFDWENATMGIIAENQTV